MHNILYKTTNLINNKYYIGIHCTEDIKDTYLGSGTLLKKAIKKYGKHNFKREILQEVNTIGELVELEKKVVNIDFCKDRNTYNMEVGGRGGKIWTKELKEKMSSSIQRGFVAGREVWNKGKKTGPLSESTKMKMSESTKGEKNPMYGISCCTNMSLVELDKWKSNISKGNIGKTRTEKQKEKYSKYATNRIWIVHISGRITHTQNPNDSRLNHKDWQRGMKWDFSK